MNGYLNNSLFSLRRTGRRQIVSLKKFQISVILKLFLMAHNISRTERQVWNADLLWRTTYHVLLLKNSLPLTRFYFVG